MILIHSEIEKHRRNAQRQVKLEHLVGIIHLFLLPPHMPITSLCQIIQMSVSQN